MNLSQRYMKLTFWNKLAFWGSLASIIGLILSLFSMFIERSEKANISVEKSPNVIVQKNEAASVQSMVNSPGGIQSIGDNVTINKGPKPRTLNLIQRNSLSNILNSRQIGTIEILCPSNNLEACSFGSEIGNVLKGAGWAFGGVVQNPFGAFPPGLTILVHTAQDQPPGARILQDALSSIGYSAGGNYNNDLSSSKMVLLVGPQAD